MIRRKSLTEDKRIVAYLVIGIMGVISSIFLGNCLSAKIILSILCIILTCAGILIVKSGKIMCSIFSEINKFMLILFWGCIGYYIGPLFGMGEYLILLWLSPWLYFITDFLSYM